MTSVIISIAVICIGGWMIRMEKFKLKEEQRAKAELAFLKDIYEQTDSEDIRENLICIANSLLDRDYWLVRQFDEDTRGWWWEKIKASDERFASNIKTMVEYRKENN